MVRFAITSFAFVACIASLTACGPVSFFVSYEGAPAMGLNWHVCFGGGECPEGWACTKDGCEWCGDEPGAQTRCTEGND